MKARSFALAAAMALSMTTGGHAVMPEAPRVPPPRVSNIGRGKGGKERARESLRRARRLKAKHLAASAAERKRRAKWKDDPERDLFRAAVNALTNHQRHQWARAGYAGLHDHDRAEPIAFLHPLHPLRAA